VKILGVRFWSTLRQTVSASWTQFVEQVKIQAKDAYSRDLSLAHRIIYVHTYLLSRICYVVQVLPAHQMSIQQIIAAVTYFIWRAAIFRFQISTLQSRRKGGGWELMDIAAKCRAPLLSRMHIQSARPGAVMAGWLYSWDLNGRTPNPPNATAYPTVMVHMRAYALDMPYATNPRLEEAPKTWCRRVYWVLQTMYITASPPRPLRIMKMYANNNWSRIWLNLHTAWIPDTVRSTWYIVIHDILPTKERLNRIGIADSDHCNHCGHTDTMYHRIMECEAGRDM
jgi:hypothetical protein